MNLALILILFVNKIKCTTSTNRAPDARRKFCYEKNVILDAVVVDFKS